MKPSETRAQDAEAQPEPLLCPRCGSTDIVASRRRGIEYFLHFIGMDPFRCAECRHRFRRLSWELREGDD